MSDIQAASDAIENAQRELLSRRNTRKFWEGKLSSSALSTATATFALLRFAELEGNRTKVASLIDNGVAWVIAAQNPDGGWGDTSLSKSNVSTTVLCWALLKANANHVSTSPIERAEAWLTSEGIGTSPDTLAKTINARYGTDKTFSVPILTMLALTGSLGSNNDCWKYVMQLPFELAVLPNKIYPMLRLPVVSYAIPALIAIGLVKHRRAPSNNPIVRALRNAATPKVLAVLTNIQPASGGFLEAAPLTSFVVMSLIAAGLTEHQVVTAGIAFLTDTVREDGSWPIDTDLSSWISSLATIGLLESDINETLWPAEQRKALADLILEWQYKEIHPFTQSPPGAWAWTERSGGVPDADDTPAALLALYQLGNHDDRTITAVENAVSWLCGIQNRDGGIPTFCRGWGTLPFDRSSPDLTAHTLQAVQLWEHSLSDTQRIAVDRLTHDAVGYLVASQSSDGSWSPLWFGNQNCPNDENRVYGTAKVLIGLAAYKGQDANRVNSLKESGLAWLMRVQNSDGSWGGFLNCPGSIEETSMALKAIVLTKPTDSQTNASATRAISWLLKTTSNGITFPPTPIGLYFARLWYYEREYPLVHFCSAIGLWLRTRSM